MVGKAFLHLKEILVRVLDKNIEGDTRFARKKTNGHTVAHNGHTMAHPRHTMGTHYVGK